MTASSLSARASISAVGWFKKSAEKETAACAVAGLMKMRNAAALELLEEAREQQHGEVRGLIEQAIAAITGSRGRVAGSGGG